MNDFQYGDILTCKLEDCKCGRSFIHISKKDEWTCEALWPRDNRRTDTVLEGLVKSGHLTDLEKVLWQNQLQS